MTANARLADSRRRLALQLRRQGLAGFAKWQELAEWRLRLAEEVERRRAA